MQDVLRRFRALAEQEDFVLSEFRPGQENQKDFYNEWPITVRLQGTYHNLARFFDRMSRFSRIFNVDNLQITQTRGQRPAHHPGVLHRQDLRLPGGRAGGGGGRRRQAAKRARKVVASERADGAGFCARS